MEEPSAYAPPTADLNTPHEDDVSAVTPTGATRYGSGFCFVTGATAFVAGLQTLGIARHTVLAVGAASLLMALGAGLFVSGGLIMRMRGSGAVAGLILGGLLSIGSVGWLLLTFTSLFFTVYAVLLPPLSIISTFLAWLSLGPTRRADAYRAQLMA